MATSSEAETQTETVFSILTAERWDNNSIASRIVFHQNGTGHVHIPISTLLYTANSVTSSYSAET